MSKPGKYWDSFRRRKHKYS